MGGESKGLWCSFQPEGLHVGVGYVFRKMKGLKALGEPVSCEISCLHMELWLVQRPGMQESAGQV